ncbi:MAG TPA: hypothetical protein VF221_18245 [Chloroflexota bacterium]
MSEIEIFVQGERIPEIILLRVPGNGTVRDILKSAETQGIHFAGDERSQVILVEDQGTELSPDLSLEEAHIGHRSRVHIHRCHRIEVTVNFNAAQKTRAFPPSATVERVKRWAVGPAPEGFGLQGIDATEHLLQLCHSTTRPDEDTHIGALVTFPDCGLCFDLVPKVRVEG